MSRNNVIIVAKIKNKYYVLQNLDMDTQFNQNFILKSFKVGVS